MQFSDHSKRLKDKYLFLMFSSSMAALHHIESRLIVLMVF